MVILIVKKTRKDVVPPANPNQHQNVYPDVEPPLSKIEPQSKSNGFLSFILYLVWGLISVSPVDSFLTLFFCKNCGSDTPGINLLISIAMIIFWFIITIVFLLFVRKILKLSGISAFMIVLWILFFIFGYFLLGTVSKNSQQRAQQTLEDFKKNEITESTSPYVKIEGNKLIYDDGQINFFLPDNFIAINGREAIPMFGEQKVIGFTDKSFKIRMAWVDKSKCTTDKRYAYECEAPTKPAVKESRNNNGVILRFYDLVSESIPVNQYWVSLDKNKFDYNNYLSISYDGNYQQNQYNKPTESFVSVYNSLINNINLK